MEFSGNGDVAGRGWRVAPDYSGITSVVYTRQEDLLPVNLAVSEFFPLPPQKELAFQSRQINPLPYILILLVIYSAKVFFLIRFRT
jgi:hypothetical protein